MPRGQRFPPARPPDIRLEIRGNARVGPDGWTIVAGAPGAFQAEVWARLPQACVGSQWKPWLVPSPVRVEAP